VIAVPTGRCWRRIILMPQREDRLLLMSARSSPKPRTYIGLFIQASLLRQREERQRLIGKLNAGRPGWNDDEPAVAEAAFELALRRLYPADADVRALTPFVSDLRARVSSVASLDQLETEALIRKALGDPDVVTSGISQMNAFNIYGGVTQKIIIDNGFSESEIAELVTNAEILAFKRGWSPPLT
jgi:hypothetical protein